MTFSTLKFLVSCLLLTLGSITWALPSPKDIESAVQTNQFSKAESMLREVIQEKPQSAKAHYELGEVLARQARYQDALQELNKSRELDPSLKFASDPQKFHDLVDRINKLAAPQSHSQSGTNAVIPAINKTAPQNSSGMSLMFWGLLIGFGLLVLLYFSNRPKPIPVNPYPAQQGVYPPPPAGQGFGAQYSPSGATQYPNAPVVTSGSSPIAGAVVGGLAGVAAGYALSKAFEGDHHSVSDQPRPSNDYGVNYDKPTTPDLGSFDPGSGGDNWDPPSSGNSDDEW
jgi:hypothetical protein